MTDTPTLVVSTETELVERIADIVEQLRVMAGTADLTEIVTDGLDWKLGRRAQLLFDELDGLTWLAGSTRMPHRPPVTDDDIPAFVAALEHIAATRTLP